MAANGSGEHLGERTFRVCYFVISPVLGALDTVGRLQAGQRRSKIRPKTQYYLVGHHPSLQAPREFHSTLITSDDIVICLIDKQSIISLYKWRGGERWYYWVPVPSGHVQKTLLQALEGITSRGIWMEIVMSLDKLQEMEGGHSVA